MKRISIHLLFVCCLVAASLTGCGPSTPEGKFSRAIRLGDLEEAQQIVAEGFDPKHVYENGSTALHVTAESISPDADIAKFLIEQGVDVAAVDANGRTAWELAWRYEKKKISKRTGDFLLALLDAGFEPPRPDGEKNGTKFLHVVARECQNAKLTRRLAIKKELEVEDINGWTPLHYASFHGNYEAAEGLLLSGANPNAETKKLIQDTYLKGEITMVNYRYEMGSRPMDLYHKSHTRFRKDLEGLLELHGGTSNPKVDNRF